MKAVAYCRVSTVKQADEGVSLESQRDNIDRAIRERGHDLVEIIEDAASGKSLERKGLTRALLLLEEGKADCLIVAKLDRLSRSVLGFSTLLDTASKQGWKLIALDHGMDTSTPHGKMMAQMIITFAEFERELISQRTREGLAIKRKHGIIGGRRRVFSDETRRLIRRLRVDEGKSLKDTVRELEDMGLPISISMVSRIARSSDETTQEHNDNAE